MRCWQARHRSRPAQRILISLNEQLRILYEILALGAPSLISPALQRYLRQTYLREPADLRRVRRYTTDHLTGIRSTLQATAHGSDALPLLGPEVLLVLERLASDPLGLRNSWPADEPMGPLLALAEANGRPYWV